MTKFLKNKYNFVTMSHLWQLTRVLHNISTTIKIYRNNLQSNRGSKLFTKKTSEVKPVYRNMKKKKKKKRIREGQRKTGLWVQNLRVTFKYY